jgi:hypothetical protein
VNGTAGVGMVIWAETAPLAGLFFPFIIDRLRVTNLQRFRSLACLFHSAERVKPTC